jgi:hypothetical protein
MSTSEIPCMSSSQMLPTAIWTRLKLIQMHGPLPVRDQTSQSSWSSLAHLEATNLLYKSGARSSQSLFHDTRTPSLHIFLPAALSFNRAVSRRVRILTLLSQEGVRLMLLVAYLIAVPRICFFVDFGLVELALAFSMVVQSPSLRIHFARFCMIAIFCLYAHMYSLQALLVRMNSSLRSQYTL